MDGFVASHPPTLEAFEDEDDDGDADADASDVDEDDDASSSNANEMFTSCTYPLSLVTKRESSFVYDSSHTHMMKVSIGDFC